MIICTGCIANISEPHQSQSRKQEFLCTVTAHTQKSTSTAWDDHPHPPQPSKLQTKIFTWLESTRHISENSKQKRTSESNAKAEQWQPPRSKAAPCGTGHRAGTWVTRQGRPQEPLQASSLPHPEAQAAQLPSCACQATERASRGVTPTSAYL